MNSQNFKNGTHRFPVSTESLEFIQQQIYLIARLSSLAGTNVIIKQPTSITLPGAQTQLLSFDSQYSPFAGLVVINGLLYPLYGDATKPYISISTTQESVQVPGEQDPLQVRTYRYAYYCNSGTYNAENFMTVNSIKTLMSRIATIEGAYMSETAIRALVSSTQNTLQTALNTTNGNLSALAGRVGTIENNYKTASEINELLNANARHHLPLCSVIDWFCSGYIKYSKVPYGFVPCGKVIIGSGISASSLSLELGMWRSEFPDIQISSGTVTKSSTSYTYIQVIKCNGIDIPDLTDRFVVQAGYSYDKFGVGGESKHTLNVDEMPKHNHISENSVNNGYVWTTENEGHHKHQIPAINADGWGSKVRGGSESNASANPETKDDGNHRHTLYLYARGAGSPHNNMPPYFGLYKLIKVI